jgi:hypothetical protein
MQKPYDVVIVAHEKDFGNIKYIIKYADKNLTFDSIHLILSSREFYKDFDIIDNLTSKPIYLHDEEIVLKIDKSQLKYRPNWMYQMMLKFFQNVTYHDNYLVIEADSIIIKTLEFFDQDKTIYYLGGDQYHEPYFKFNKAILNIGREYNHSFISEFMMYDKKIIKDILFKTNSNTPKDFLELLYKLVTPDCYPADYELYGNFVFKYHQDKFMTRDLNYFKTGREDLRWTDDEIDIFIKTQSHQDVISFHKWEL